MSDHEGVPETMTYLDTSPITLMRNAHAFAACGKAKWRGVPLWAFVRDLCCVGSTSASEICQSLGWDPHQDAAKALPRA
jgi:hypothetical protein